MRFDRRTFWGMIGFIVVMAGLLCVIDAPRSVLSTLLPLTMGIVVPDRLRDLGYSGRWAVVPFLFAVLLPNGGPLLIGGFVILAVFVIVLGVLPGQPGANRFGPRPGGRSRHARA